MNLPTKKSKQLKKKSNFLQFFVGKMNLQKLPIIRTMWKKQNFYKTVQESLKWYHNDHDPKELARTNPPKSEKIELHCAWVTEAYTPSNINSLIKSLKRLGWEKPEGSIGTKPSLVGWIQQDRSFGGHSSWMNGGIILSRSDTNRFLGADVRRAKLPSGVEYGLLSIHNVTSSLTLVTIQFVFNDKVADSLNEPFNSLYKTRVQYCSSRLRSRGAIYIGVIEQKRQAIKKKIDTIHAGLYLWFSDNLPGHYSFSKEEALPTVDLITSRKYEQLKENKSRLKDHYTDLLFDYGIEIWTYKEDANLELRLPWRSIKKPTATLFGNYDKLTQGTDQYGGKDRAALTSTLHMAFDVTMRLWATHNLLLSYEQQLSAIRDRAAFHIKGTREALKNLKYIRYHFLSISKDTRVISSDVATLFKSKRHYSADGMDFDPPHYFKDVYPTFLELMRQQDKWRMKQLTKLESRVNETIISSGNLTLAIANLRIQRNVLWFTIFVAILTLLSVFRNDLLNLLQQILTF